MKKMQKMIAVLFSVAMCAAMAVPAFAAETDTARNEEQETVMPRAIVYEEINIPGDGKFYKITDDFEMPAKSRVSFQGTWSPAYARLEFRLYAHSTGNGAYVMLTSGREGGLDASCPDLAGAHRHGAGFPVSLPPVQRRRSGASRPSARCPPRLRQNRCNPPRRGNPYHGSARRCKAP